MRTCGFDAGIDAMERASVTPACEYMREATPEMVWHAMACYMDGLIQGGMTLEKARATASEETRRGIEIAASSLREGA